MPARRRKHRLGLPHNERYCEMCSEARNGRRASTLTAVQAIASASLRHAEPAGGQSRPEKQETPGVSPPRGLHRSV